MLAGLGVYLVVTDALARRRAGVRVLADGCRAPGLVTFVLFVPVALLVYVASWTGWLVTDGGYDRHAAERTRATGLWSWCHVLRSIHVRCQRGGITSGHAYASPAWQWPLLIRPTGMYYHHDAFGVNGCAVAERVLAKSSRACRTRSSGTRGSPRSSTSAYRFVVARDWRYALVLTGIAVTYVPWLFFPARTVFQFYTVLVLPFMLLALTFALQATSPGPRRPTPTAG